MVQFKHCSVDRRSKHLFDAVAMDEAMIEGTAVTHANFSIAVVSTCYIQRHEQAGGCFGWMLIL